MKTGKYTVIAGIASALLVLSLLVGCVNIFAFNNDFYKDEYAKLGAAEYVGVSEENLNEATDVLLDYLKDERKDIELQSDQGDSFYSEREKLHMVDVKALYQNCCMLAWCFLIVGGGMVAFIIISRKKDSLVHLVKGFTRASIFIIAFFAFIGIAAAIDFNTFWVNFHRLFFTNDLWMLDPANSRMIRMYQESFFFDMVTGILLLFLSIFIGLLVASVIILYIKRRKEEQDEGR